MDRPHRRRRRLMIGLGAAVASSAILWLRVTAEAASEAKPRPATNRPPPHHYRMTPFIIPIQDGRPFLQARVEVDLILTSPGVKDKVRPKLPRIIGQVLAESWAAPAGAGGRIGAEGAKAIKERVLEASQATLGPEVVEDVLLVSLLEL